MNSRLYFKAVCLFVLLGVSACSKSPSAAVENVLNKCAKVTAQLNQTNLTAAAAAQEFATRMQAIDTRECPQEFRVAFQQHVNAWSSAAPAFSNNTGLNAFLEGLAAGYTGDISYLGQSSSSAAAAAQRINLTYADLVTIAAYYGARVPQSSLER